MDFDLSEQEYVEKCLEQYRKNKALAEQKYAEREQYIKRNEFQRETLSEAKELMKNESSTKYAFILYESIRGIIRCATGLRSFVNLQAQDIPRARAIANKVFDIVREERR